jgi:hypothetical protein
MINWIVTINRPEYCETKEFMVPKDKVTELLEDLLNSYDLSISASITIKPTDMEYFDGRPEL